MSQSLGRLEDLPLDYRDDLDAAQVSPLWPQMRNVLPHNTPAPITQPTLWAFDKVRPLLLRGVEIVAIVEGQILETAERLRHSSSPRMFPGRGFLLVF